MAYYRAAILGSGQGGTPLAHALSAAGWKTALIEKEHVGGCCINEGCTPTKTIIASGRVAYLAQRAADYGVHVGTVTVNLKQVRARKRSIVDTFRASSQKRLQEAPNLDLIFGTARFTDAHTVEVAGPDGTIQEITADTIIINTGCSPRPATIPGIEHVPVVDSTSIMELEAVPEHLIVVGAGYISLEFAQVFRRFGSRVTILVRGDQLLAREDPEICGALLQILQEDGIKVLFQTEIQALEPGPMGLKADIGKGSPLEGSVLLTAMGRIPNTPDLNLPSTGITTDGHGFINVDPKLCTDAPHIYAIGDIKGGPAFTHISYDDFRILKTNLLENGSKTTTGRHVPYTLFTDPQLGRIGLTEQQARAAGYDIQVATLPMTSVARALEMDEARGLIKVIVKKENEQIVGFAMLGIEGGEVMAVIETAIMARLPYTALQEATWAHPTLAEALNTLFAQL